MKSGISAPANGRHSAGTGAISMPRERKAASKLARISSRVSWKIVEDEPGPDAGQDQHGQRRAEDEQCRPLQPQVRKNQRTDRHGEEQPRSR